MTNSVNSLQQMAARRDQWLNEKPGFSGGDNLRIGNGDIIWCQFVASGDDGDRFIKVYRAHQFQAMNAKGGRISPTRYCPRANGDPEECPYCAQGHTDIKERMSIWFWVPMIYRAQIAAGTTPDKMPQAIMHEGRTMFMEETNAFKVWHTSAWKNSPWSDILKLHEMYGTLHGFAAQLVRSGEGMQTVYKLYALPNTPNMSSVGISPEKYQEAQQACKPIIDILKEELATPIAINPATAQQPQTQTLPNNIVPAANPFGAPATVAPSANPFAIGTGTPTAQPANPFQVTSKKPLSSFLPGDPANVEPEAPADTSPPWTEETPAEESGQPQARPERLPTRTPF